MPARHAAPTRAAPWLRLAWAVLACGAACADSQMGAGQVVRVATFNASLNRDTEGGLKRSLESPDDPQIRAVAEIIQRVRPDILLLQEFDFDADGAALRAFLSNYLARPQNGAEPIEFAYTFAARSNTGVPSGFDLDNDGRVGGGGDALGFGAFPGQYGMVVLSKYAVDREHVRTFRKLLWRDMPGALLPDKLETPQPFDWYTSEELAMLPLSSKSHWDVPVRIGKMTLHLLVSHPTPPTFDGREDRNGLRNHDEIRFWIDYLSDNPGEARYIRDDSGKQGGFASSALTEKFIIMGDLNSDPEDGDSHHEAIRALLAHPRIDASHVPQSTGGAEAARLQGGANATQRGDSAADTADFSDRVAGNLRADYLLPSKGLTVCGQGIFWPTSTDAHASLVWGSPPPSSDHRLVWLDITADGARCPPGSDPTANATSRPRH